MRKVIHKFHLWSEISGDLTGIVHVLMPMSAEVISVGVQHESVVVWALVNAVVRGAPLEKEESREFLAAMTGQEVDLSSIWRESWVFRGTVGLHGNGFILHVFEKKMFYPSRD